MAFMDFLFGKGSKTKTQPIYSPEQENLLNQILSSLQAPIRSGAQNLQNILGGDEAAFEAAFEAFERPARRAFEQQTLPTIAERFTGAFGEGSQRSSAFGQALGVAGRELEENLAAQRSGLQSDAWSQVLQLLAPALAPRQHQYQTGRTPGFLESLGVPLAQGASQALTSFLL